MSTSSDSDPPYHNLASLPPELCCMVASHLSNSDMKTLRLTCRALRDKYPLRLDRVMLSANPLNVQVFLSVAEHETYRHGIVEIIWDDSRLLADGDLHPGEENIIRWQEGITSDDEVSDDEENPEDRRPRWYRYLCRMNSNDERKRKCVKNLRAHEARRQQSKARPPKESWAYYRGLLRQQQEVLSSGADIDALRYGLSRFTGLQRITVTPVAHGILFKPLYETPMIRAFPYGFNYPLPRSWPGPLPWAEGNELLPWDHEEERRHWRGVRAVLRELAAHKSGVVELLFDANNANAGVSCRLFERECDEYDGLVTLLQRPGFRRLDLSLRADGNWEPFTNGLLCGALSEATDLEHLDLRTHIDLQSCSGRSFMMVPPISTVLPVDRWPKLRHLGLVNVVVNGHDDLMAVLAGLANTIRSVELSRLQFVGDDAGEGYQGLMIRLRDQLDWRRRPQGERPRVMVSVVMRDLRRHRQRFVASPRHAYLCVNKEVEDFIYGEAENPFGPPGDWTGMWPKRGVGVMRDPFEPEFESFD